MINKSIFRETTGAKNYDYIDNIYNAIIKFAPTYGITNEKRMIAFLSQIGAESGGLFYSEELSSGAQYENNSNLGNTQPNDGKKFKGRGLIQLTGRYNYQAVSDYLKQDFINNPQNLAPTNAALRNNTASTLQYENSVKSSMFYWNTHKVWGDFNKLADNIDISSPINDGGLIEKYPTIYRGENEDTKVKKTFGINLSSSKKVYLSDALGLSRASSFHYFELICLNVNGGYNGFLNRYENFIAGVEGLTGNDFRDDNENNNNDAVVDNNNDGVIDDSDRVDNGKENNDPSQNNQFNGGIENVFKPTINLKEIEFAAEGITDGNLIGDLGNNPFVWFNNIQLNVLDHFVLSTEGFLPTVRITFTDQYGVFSNKNFPLDNAKLTVFINSSTPTLKSIFLEFKVLEFTKNDNVYSLSGILNVDMLLVRDMKSYPNMTSYEVLKQVARDSGLGFSSNIKDTDDAMTWINFNKRVVDFLEDDVVPKSYMSDESFLWAYVDLYYNLNYIDIETQLLIDISNQLGVFTTPMSDLGEKLSKDNNVNTSALYLTNDSSHRSTNQYFNDEDCTVINTSTKISIQKGYISKFKSYDITLKEFLLFDVDSISTAGDSNIVLKGSENDKVFYEKNYNSSFIGKIDVSNMHKNYLYAVVQNAHNIEEIEKIGMIIDMKSANFNFYKFQKISVILITQGPTTTAPLLNKRLSGDWLIVDLLYDYSDGSTGQKVKLMRRDLGLMDDEQFGAISNSEQKEEIKNSSDTSNNTDNFNESDIIDTSETVPDVNGNTSSNTPLSPDTSIIDNRDSEVDNSVSSNTSVTQQKAIVYNITYSNTLFYVKNNVGLPTFTKVYTQDYVDKNGANTVIKALQFEADNYGFLQGGVSYPKTGNLFPEF